VSAFKRCSTPVRAQASSEVLEQLRTPLVAKAAKPNHVGYNRPMRFIGYGRATIRGAKIDWETPVTLTAEARAALLPHDPKDFRCGQLRRPFHVKPRRPGTRSSSAIREEVVHPKGALVFATADESWFLVGVADGEE
jgi:hypothetical protein